MYLLFALLILQRKGRIILIPFQHSFADGLPVLIGKAAAQRYASKNSPLRSGPKDTFNISYVGKVDWGALSEFITAAYAITEGHLMVEVLTAGNRFCLSFETLCDTERYLDEFLNVLREEGVPYTVGETEQSNLPRIELRS